MVSNTSIIMSDSSPSYLIPVYRPFLVGREREYVNQCLDSTWISSKGDFIQRFEREFSNFVGGQYCTSVCNGTVALHLALEAIGVGPGDEVIVPTLTYVASVNTIIQAGATPVFVDSLAATWQIDPNDVRRKISRKTKAVMAVHLYGLPCDMDEIVSICKEHGLLLVEDCAEAIGTRFRDRHVGTFGDVATFSFFGNKTITTGEGGMVLAKKRETLERAASLKSQGISQAREYWHDVLGYNYRMTNICAAIGTAQLEQVNEILIRKRTIAERYEIGLKNLPLKVHTELPNTMHSFWMCSIAVDNVGDRDPLRAALRGVGVETRPLFFPAHKLPHCYSANEFPVAESLSARGINLPSYPGLSENDQNLIIRTIRHYFGSVR